MNRRDAISFVMLIVIVVFAISGFADDRPPSDEEINSLIQQLASPNQPPKIGVSARYPADYDHDAQKRVRSAWTRLHKCGPQSFPYLFDHFDDKRYSFTADAGSEDYNWSVGKACFDIVRCHLQPLGTFSLSSGDRHGGGGRPRPNYFYRQNLQRAAEAKRWWESRKQKSLCDLQIEVLDWVITEEAKTPKEYSDEERTYLLDLLTKLRAGNVPLTPTLPWAL
jgi:hypothetical protein